MAQLLLLSSLFVGSSVALSGWCGSNGDGFGLNFIMANFEYIYAPTWIFGLHSGQGAKYCEPTPTDTCNITQNQCNPTFEAGQVKTYDYACVVRDIAYVNTTVSQLQDFVPGGNSFCPCRVEYTPPGKYMFGYVLTIDGTVKDGIVTYEKSCCVKSLYQDTPLAKGSVFHQIMVLNGVDDDKLWGLF